jgi:hypothetical protein
LAKTASAPIGPPAPPREKRNEAPRCRRVIAAVLRPRICRGELGDQRCHDLLDNWLRAGTARTEEHIAVFTEHGPCASWFAREVETERQRQGEVREP